MRIVLRGLVRRGKDGKHHDHDCCRILHAWTQEEKGFRRQVFLRLDWELPTVPQVGAQIYMVRDTDDVQEVTVEEVRYAPDQTIEVWVGGWTHWEAVSVIDLFETSRAYAVERGWDKP